MKSLIRTPGSTDDHSLVWDRVGDGTVVMDTSRVKGHPIHVECDGGELHTEGQVMPLTVTNLPKVRWSKARG